MSDSISSQIVDVSHKADASGYLCKFPVIFDKAPLFPNDNTLCGLVLRQSNSVLFKKPKINKALLDDVPSNPFLPHHPDSFVTELSHFYNLLLNKFVAVPCHCLLVTKQFLPQWLPVCYIDCEAVDRVLKDIDGFVFFNNGLNSGTSQPHKHLQFIPLPLSKEVNCPLRTMVASMNVDFYSVATINQFSFKHAVVKFKHLDYTRPDFPMLILRAYQDIALFLGIKPFLSQYSDYLAHDFDDLQIYHHVEHLLPSYSFIVLRDFVFITLRKSSNAFGIDLNSSAFMGSIYVKTNEQFEFVRENGIIKILEELAE
ncbi:hypothetical protein GEMRC1_002236 [Eukaryota sp. GEM-RC1]